MSQLIKFYTMLFKNYFDHSEVRLAVHTAYMLTCCLSM